MKHLNHQIVSRKHTVKADHYEKLKQAARIRNINKRNKVKASPKFSGAFTSGPVNLKDPEVKILSWDPIGSSSVLTLGDFDPMKFALNTDGKITTIEGMGGDVIEQNLESELISVNVRRIEDTIVYAVDGKGNSIPGGEEHSVEIQAGEMQENLLPDETVIVPLMDENAGESRGFAEIRHTGEIVVHTEPNSVLAQDIPLTGVAMKMDKDVYERIWETQRLKIRARKDGDILEFAVEGKKQATNIEGKDPTSATDNCYEEMDPGSLGPEFTPKATGPIVALRTSYTGAVDNAAAFVQFCQDGSVKLFVPLTTNFADAEDKTTCTYLNVVEEGCVSVFVGSDYGKFTIFKSSNTLTYEVFFYEKNGDHQTGTVNTIPANGTVNLVSSGIIDKEFYPDREVSFDVIFDDGVHTGLSVVFHQDGRVALVNETNAQVSLKDTTAISHVHINKSMGIIDAHEQILECDKAQIDLRKDGNAIVVEVTPKDIPQVSTPTDEMIFPPGTIDYEFVPEKGDQITVELPTNNHAASSSFLNVCEDGSATLVLGTDKVVEGVTSTESYVDMDETDGLLADITLDGDCITLNARKQGSLVTYTAMAIETTIANAHEEFRNASIPKEMCPEKTCAIELPVTDVSSNADPAYVYVNPDGSVDITEGDTLDTTREAVAQTMNSGEQMVESITITGTNIQLTAKRIDEEIVYEAEAIRSDVPAGITDEILPTDALPEKFRPTDGDIIVPIACEGDITANAYLEIKEAGTAQLSTDGNALITDVVSTETEVNGSAAANDPYVEEDEFMITQEVTNPTSFGRREMNASAPEGFVDFMKVKLKRFGKLVKMAIQPQNRSTTAGQHTIYDGGATIPKQFIPPYGEKIVAEVLTSSTVTTAVCDRAGIVSLLHDGKIDLLSAGDILRKFKVSATYADTISEDVIETEVNLDNYLDETTRGLGSWLKAKFRKIKDTFVSIVSGVGKLAQNINVSAEIAGIAQVGLNPTDGLKIDIKPGGANGGSGTFKINPDGTLGLSVHGASGSSINFNSGMTGKSFAAPYAKVDDGDIFNDEIPQLTHNMHVTLHKACHSMQVVPYALYGEGHMVWNERHEIEDGVAIVVHTVTRRRYCGDPEGFMDFVSGAFSFLKSNIDFKAIGGALLKGGGALVSGLMSGKSLGQAASGAFKEVTSGGISSFLKPDGLIGGLLGTKTGGSQPAGTGQGLLGGVMQLLPNGGANIVKKAADFVGSKFPFAASFINKAKGLLGDAHQLALCEKNSKPRNEQHIDGTLHMYAVRYGMDVTYHIYANEEDRTNGIFKVSEGSYKLRGKLKESLAPDNDIANYITPYVQVVIHKDGTYEFNVSKDQVFGSEQYTVRAVKEYRPYGSKFQDAEVKQVKTKRSYNRKK